nr:MAG TPA: Aldos-2-ulose dehydratase/isomerase cupin domain protein [Caudoviricetes sp.]DAS19769.1 MAG TPA: Aldos-2-ulose dehydratase/isomerase cupin domain protein [Caudoviricetes sp.]
MQFYNSKGFPFNLYPSFSYLTFCETHTIL